MKSFRKDANFLYWTLVGALLFMAFLHIINPLIQPPEPDTPSRERVQQANDKIVVLRASEVAPMLRDSHGRNSLVFVYTSWCGFCKQMMPDLVDLLKRGKLGDTQVYFLSLDSRRLQLAEYLARHGYDEQFQPFQVKSSAVNSLEDVLAAGGANYQGPIPYIASFSAQGRMLGEEVGLVSSARIIDLATMRADTQ